MYIFPSWCKLVMICILLLLNTSFFSPYSFFFPSTAHPLHQIRLNHFFVLCQHLYIISDTSTSNITYVYVNGLHAGTLPVSGNCSCCSLPHCPFSKQICTNHSALSGLSVSAQISESTSMLASLHVICCTLCAHRRVGHQAS